MGKQESRARSLSERNVIFVVASAMFISAVSTVLGFVMNPGFDMSKGLFEQVLLPSVVSALGGYWLNGQLISPDSVVYIKNRFLRAFMASLWFCSLYFFVSIGLTTERLDEATVFYMVMLIPPFVTPFCLVVCGIHYRIFPEDGS